MHGLPEAEDRPRLGGALPFGTAAPSSACLGGRPSGVVALSTAMAAGSASRASGFSKVMFRCPDAASPLSLSSPNFNSKR